MIAARGSAEEEAQAASSRARGEPDLCPMEGDLNVDDEGEGCCRCDETEVNGEEEECSEG